VDAAKPLFETVRVPGQVVIDHQMGPLQVDTFARRVRGDEHLCVLILREERFVLLSFLTAHASVNGHDGFRLPDQRPNPIMKVVQCVAMLAENDQLAAMTMSIEHLRLVLQ